MKCPVRLVVSMLGEYGSVVLSPKCTFSAKYTFSAKNTFSAKCTLSTKCKVLFKSHVVNVSNINCKSNGWWRLHNAHCILCKLQYACCTLYVLLCTFLNVIKCLFAGLTLRQPQNKNSIHLGSEFPVSLFPGPFLNMRIALCTLHYPYYIIHIALCPLHYAH